MTTFLELLKTFKMPHRNQSSKAESRSTTSEDKIAQVPLVSTMDSFCTVLTKTYLRMRLKGFHS